MSQSFTILSTQAPLVEVDGDGPANDRPSGVLAAAGVPTTTPVDLLNGFFRRFRVDAPSTTQTVVAITASPFGAFVALRRCVAVPQKRAGILSPQRWPKVRDTVRRFVPTVGALWHLLTDDFAVPNCRWQSIGDGDHDHVIARGGDVVVVTFVVP